MKILHLSDLHIGKNLDNISMLDEQKHAFAQIINYIKDHKPIVIIIAGDVYDRAVPSVEAVRVFDDFITELATLKVTIMLVAGNHDSPERISYASRLLFDKGLFLCGTFDGAISKITLADECGDVNFWLLPFIKPSSLRGICNETAETYEDAVAAVLNQENIDYTTRNILISHQFYTKSGHMAVRSESELDPVGGLDAVDISLIENFDYVALGHLHGAQSVRIERIRYCGSPIKYSFSEWRQKKSVTLVELKEKGNLTITALPLIPIHDMRVIKGKMEHLISAEVVSQADSNDYIWATLTDEEEIIDPMEKLRRHYPNILKMDFDNARTGVNIGEITASIETIEKLRPYDLFEEFFLKMQGSTMNKEQSKIVHELLERTIRS
ncbi:MAG: exonuclease SbcCD subunit D [Defluviitaleaceae bacterium]|nr:exonuclease SbcCD subunit D [Defluviitaleaceae bacterium]